MNEAGAGGDRHADSHEFPCGNVGVGRQACRDAVVPLDDRAAHRVHGADDGLRGAGECRDHRRRSRAGCVDPNGGVEDNHAAIDGRCQQAEVNNLTDLRGEAAVCIHAEHRAALEGRDPGDVGRDRGRFGVPLAGNPRITRGARVGVQHRSVGEAVTLEKLGRHSNVGTGVTGAAVIRNKQLKTICTGHQQSKVEDRSLFSRVETNSPWQAGSAERTGLADAPDRFGFIHARRTVRVDRGTLRNRRLHGDVGDRRRLALACAPSQKHSRYFCRA